MSGVAFANGHSQVRCEDGSRGPSCGSDPDRWTWSAGSNSTTAATSNQKFYVEGKLVAVEDDRMAMHPDGAHCTTTEINHAPQTSLHTGNFYVAGKKVLRIGSKFNRGTSFDHEITTGSGSFSIGGPNG